MIDFHSRDIAFVAVGNVSELSNFADAEPRFRQQSIVSNQLHL